MTMLEIAIKGQGEVAVALVDRKGAVLMRKRLVISGSEGLEAKTSMPLELDTHSGRVPVVPILVRRSDSLEHVTFNGRDPAAYADERCKQLKAAAGVVQKVIDADRLHDGLHLRTPEPAGRRRPSRRR